VPARLDLPATLRRSPQKAQDTYAETLDSALEQYGDGERAYRTAIASLKHTFQKVGDRWVAKKRKGPSDPRSARGGRTGGEAFGGVDFFGSTLAELRQRAKTLHIRGRWRMNKRELARAIDRKQD
jgi:cation transport regulator ChaB